ncbi:hypothetical protein F5890DRAFT_1533395 [Lentinula detonsa]|uniref:Uncharacterized protein n=1 Tax=Lentinula detonsa TaxID=2804962 RepID=A0AA38PV26_9AGAR|nr:hypothetical protein F5890DRAFT_1533395 [Lentinula detonsa]
MGTKPGNRFPAPFSVAADQGLTQILWKNLYEMSSYKSLSEASEFLFVQNLVRGVHCFTYLVGLGRPVSERWWYHALMMGLVILAWSWTLLHLCSSLSRVKNDACALVNVTANIKKSTPKDMESNQNIQQRLIQVSRKSGAKSRGTSSYKTTPKTSVSSSYRVPIVQKRPNSCTTSGGYSPKL